MAGRCRRPTVWRNTGELGANLKPASMKVLAPWAASGARGLRAGLAAARQCMPFGSGLLALTLMAGAVLAQSAIPPATPGPTNPEGGMPPGDQRPSPLPTTPPQGPGDRNNGVIPPPPGIDPEIHVPAPDPTPNTTPVIPPPGAPGGDPTVRPR